MRSNSHVPEGWRIARLGDVADVAFSSVDKKTVDGELPVELCNYTDVFYNRLIRPGMELMKATATPDECDRWTLKKGDVLFTKDSETADEIGIPAYISDDLPNVLCGYHLGRARPDAREIDGSFLARALASHESARAFARIANGITRFGLTLDATRSLPILLPPMSEQRAIAAVLDSIDETIERTEEVIAATERLRDALLHDLLTRGVPGRHTEFKQVRGLGTIPASWDVVRLGDLADIRGEQVTPRADDQRPYIGLEHIIAGGALSSFGKAGDSISNKTVFRNGDTLYGKLRPNLRKVVRAEFHGVCSTDILAVFAKTRAHPRFVSLLLQSDALHQHAMRGTAGTKMPRTSWKHLRRFAVGLPPRDEQRAIADTLDSIDQTIERSVASHRALEASKSSAADTLLSGSSRLNPDTEAI